MWVLTKSLWYLMDTVLSLYTMLLMLRLLLQWLHANYFNPLCQFVIRITSPVVKPLQHWLPTWHGLDFAVLALILLLTILKGIFLGWVLYTETPRLFGLLIWSSGDIVQNMVHLFMYLIIGRMVLSWIHNVQLAPVLEVLYQLTEPTLRQVKRVFPPIAGYDLSPFLLVVVLQLLLILLVDPLELYGQQHAFHANIVMN